VCACESSALVAACAQSAPADSPVSHSGARGAMARSNWRRQRQCPRCPRCSVRGHGCTGSSMCAVANVITKVSLLFDKFGVSETILVQ
jgi:hypothetical protein